MKFKQRNQRNTIQIYLLQKKKGGRKKENRKQKKKIKKEKVKVKKKEKRIKKEKKKKSEEGRRKREEERKKVKKLTKYQLNLLHVVLPTPIPFCLVLYSSYHYPSGSEISVSSDEDKSETSVPGSLQGGRLWWWWYSSSSSF